MSAISTYLEYIRSKVYAKDVRTAIVNAISQCYDDVNAPALQTEAMQAAVQAKIDAGEMAALTIADGSLTGAKLANGTIPTAKIADEAVTAGKIASDVIANLKEYSKQSYEMAFGGSVLTLPTETVTRNGVTFTATSTGITANGTATANAIFGIDFTVLKSGNYRLSGCPSGGASTKYYQRINGISGMDTGSGAIVELTERTNYSLWIVIVKGKTVDNITFSTSLVFDEISLKSLNTGLSYKLDIGYYDLETERGINLVSGSLQTSTMGVATAIQGIACTKKIPVNPNETIEIFVPKIDDDTVEYTYRFGQYRENGTYKSQIEATASNKLTIASDCYYFSFGAYAKKDGQAIAYSFFEALKDKAPVAVIFTDRPKEDYTSKAQVQSMIDKSIFANTDINYLNQNLKNVLIQAKRPMNLSGNAYLSQIQPVALLHFSDIHGDYVELSRMVKFKTEYADYLDDTICTGDIVEARWANDFNFWGNTEGTDDILLAIGNHDVLTAPYPSWDWSQRATQQEQYDRYFAPFIANWGCQYTAGLTYYYKDYTEKKLRLIVLNCMLTAEDEAGQLTWFVNTLENARTNDLSVVVANHFPLPDPVKVDCNFTSIDKTYGNTDILPVHYLSAINDFTTAGGKFVCHIAGHTHTDYVVKSTAYPNQIMIIVDALSRNQGNQYSDTQRTNDTRSQDLANVIVFDTSSKDIKIMRVGANMDHHLRVKNYITINYNTGAIITSN